MSPKASWMLVHEVLPRLHSSIPNAVRCVGAEDHEELVQDGTAMTARMLVNAEANGKKVTAGNVAYFTIQHFKSGRRSVGNSSADVLATGTQFSGKSSVGSLEEEVASESEFGVPLTWNDLISQDRDDPAQRAMRKLDWEEFMELIDEKQVQMLEWIGEGRPLSGLVDRLKVSESKVRTLKGMLVRKLREHFGEDIWVVLSEQPQWRINIVAIRERMACRYERRTARCH